jgi:hypothetical protein
VKPDHRPSTGTVRTEPRAAVRDNGVDLAAVRARPAALVLTAGVYLGRLTPPPGVLAGAYQRLRPPVLSRALQACQTGRPPYPHRIPATAVRHCRNTARQWTPPVASPSLLRSEPASNPSHILDMTTAGPRTSAVKHLSGLQDRRPGTVRGVSQGHCSRVQGHKVIERQAVRIGRT